MNWVDSAVLAAAMLAAVNVIDSHLITRRLPSLKAFLLPVAVIAIVFGVIALVVIPIPEGTGNSPVLVAVGSGIIRAVGILLFLYVMRTEEVSRVIPVVNIHPVLVAIMAVPLLDETLAGLEWLAIFMTVSGAILISRRRGSQSSGKRLRWLLVLPFIAAFCLAVANLTSKHALEDFVLVAEDISFISSDMCAALNMYAIGSLTLGACLLMVALRPAVLKQLCNLQRPRSTMTLLTFNEIMAPVAAILLFWSIARGPVSLVSAIAGAQPVFVFVYAAILSRISSGVLLEKQMEKRTMILRFMAIAMIVGGMTIIHLVGD